MPTHNPDEKRAIIASRIKEARKAAGLSQGQLAGLLGMQRPSVSEIEAGNRRVSGEEISRLVELLDVSSSWLLGRDAERADPHDTKLQLAARELAKLKPVDLERLLQLLSSMRDEEAGR
jgi:transcriptional regulator with XRE-family HTH domain